MARSEADRESVLADLPPHVADKLRLYADLLVRWQKTINLVAPSTLPALWSRHIADSMQVQAAAPDACRWVDLGSGGGLPGLITAILLANVADARIHLVESDKRKAAFLRTAIRETGAPAIVHAERIETFVPAHDEPVDAVSARALAPLPRLVSYAQRFLDAGAVGVFPKGEMVSAELTGFVVDRRFRIDSIASRIRNGSSLLIVRAESRTAGGD